MKHWRVDDVMTTDVVTVSESTPYRQIVDLMMERHVSAVPVVDDVGRVVGVVSEADLLCKVELADEAAEPRVFEGRHRRRVRTKAGGRVAADLMSSPAIPQVGATPLSPAAKTMDAERVERLRVVNGHGRLIGIVTRSDLLKVHLRSEEEIRRDVVDEILRRLLVLDEGLVQVEVAGGVVTLSGAVDRRSTAEIASRLSRQVPG